MSLDPLYHWAPAERRVSILREGLLPYSDPVVHSPSAEGVRLAYPYVCLGVTPSAAWGLSGDTLDDDEHDWDLWQVRLAETANVHVRPFWGPHPQEVRVRSAIGADCVWHVATRFPASAVALDTPAETRESVLREALERIARRRRGKDAGVSLELCREDARKALRRISTMLA